MATTNTAVSLAVRRVVRILEIALKTAVTVFLAQLVLSAFATPGVVDLSDTRKAAVAGVAAGLHAVLAAFGFVAGNPNSTALLPARLDPATPPNAPIPLSTTSAPGR